MAIDMLIKEAEGLTDTDMEKVCEYIHFLKYRVKMQGTGNPSQGKKRTAGGLEGPLVMSDDFDEPLDCFEEYM